MAHRIRTIKPEFWEDEKIGALSFGARLLFLACLNLADDEGRLRWSPHYLKANVFMYDTNVLTEDVVRFQGELTEASLIAPYKPSGEVYAEVVNFRRHQTINRPSKSRLPAPTSTNRIPHGDLSEDSVRAHGRNREQGTGNREHSPSGSARASARPPARTRELASPPEAAPATVESSISAADVVAAWIESTQSNGVSPTARMKGMVAKEAKSLLEAGNNPDRVLMAAVDSGLKGFPNLERELTAMSGRAIPRRVSNKPTRDDKVRALLELAQREENSQ